MSVPQTGFGVWAGETSTEFRMTDPGYELVRVSRELVDEMLDRESPPVVLVGLKRYDDETIELIFRVPND